MSKGGSEVKETSQQRAMTEFAVNQLQDYTKRWLPLQKRLAAQTMESGAAGFGRPQVRCWPVQRRHPDRIRRG